MFDFCLELTESLKQIEVIKQQSTPCSAKSPYQDSTLSPHKQKSRSLFLNSKANGSSPLSLNHHRTIAIISLARLPTTTSLPSSPSTLLAKLQHYSTLATTTILPLTINTSFKTSPTLFATQSPLRHPQSSPSVFFKNVEPMQEHFFATFIPQKVHSI